LLEHIRGFDARFIGSNVCEETDVCLRIKQSGSKLIFQPSAVVDHMAAPREGMTRGRVEKDPKRAFWGAHNRAYLFFKNFGVNYWSVKHILGGRQLLFIKALIAEPSWVRVKSTVLYAIGAWWGLADSVVQSVRLARGDIST
jgi:GT2 family glycosyltransferase